MNFEDERPVSSPMLAKLLVMLGDLRFSWRKRQMPPWRQLFRQWRYLWTLR